VEKTGRGWSLQEKREDEFPNIRFGTKGKRERENIYSTGGGLFRNHRLIAQEETEKETIGVRGKKTCREKLSRGKRNTRSNSPS